MISAMALSVMAQNSTPQWVQELQRLNADLIDSIVACEPDEDAPQYDSYLIYYHQPLSHANPQGAQISAKTRQRPLTTSFSRATISIGISWTIRLLLFSQGDVLRR